MMKTLVIGFGHVGQKLAEILFFEGDGSHGLASLNLTFTGIYTQSRGALLDTEGINVKQALLEIRKNGCFDKNNPQQTSIPLTQAIDELDYDLLIELSTLSIENKGEPAITYITKALERKKHVVTANKGPVAFTYGELSNLARKNNVQFRIESTVMDGAPVFNLAKQGLKGARVIGLSGILNSTTNYILSQMEKGKGFKEALNVAQSEGFAEADPHHDIDGWDSAAKIAALTNVLMQADITPDDIKREGISNITPEKITKALQSGKRWKLICRAWRDKNRVLASVMPEEISQQDLFAAIEGSGSCLRIETDLMNPIVIVQDSPTIKDTAYGVLNDILAVREIAGC
jgi:homoserine dehydrogenase